VAGIKPEPMAGKPLKLSNTLYKYNIFKDTAVNKRNFIDFQKLTDFQQFRLKKDLWWV
jgi:hypothetical protein